MSTFFGHSTVQSGEGRPIQNQPFQNTGSLSATFPQNHSEGGGTGFVAKTLMRQTNQSGAKNFNNRQNQRQKQNTDKMQMQFTNPSGQSFVRKQVPPQLHQNPQISQMNNIHSNPHDMHNASTLPQTFRPPHTRGNPVSGFRGGRSFRGNRPYNQPNQNTTKSIPQLQPNSHDNLRKDPNFIKNSVDQQYDQTQSQPVFVRGRGRSWRGQRGRGAKPSQRVTYRPKNSAQTAMDVGSPQISQDPQAEVIDLTKDETFSQYGQINENAEQTEKRKSLMTNSLTVKNIIKEREFSEKSLHNTFSAFGEIIKLEMNRSRKTAYITFKQPVNSLYYTYSPISLLLLLLFVHAMENNH